MKIVVFGASGSVGQAVTLSLLSDFSDIHLVLFYHSRKGNELLLGMANDVLVGNGRNNITVSNKIESLKNTDVYILCAGKSVPNDPDANNEKINNRNTLYDDNVCIVSDIVEMINKVCPDALGILVTNPVSRLLVNLYQRFPYMTFVGVGVTNDTLRVRNEYAIRTGKGIPNDFFVVGEHDVENQCMYFDDINKYSDVVFELQFANLDSKHRYISNLKKKQNNMIKEGSLEWNEDLPIMYSSYFRHRYSHFLYKTHLSTAKAVLEVVKAFVYSDRVVSVETLSEDRTFVVGIPVKFVDGEVCHRGDFEEIKSIMKTCREKYSI